MFQQQGCLPLHVQLQSYTWRGAVEAVVDDHGISQPKEGILVITEASRFFQGRKLKFFRVFEVGRGFHHVI